VYKRQETACGKEGRNTCLVNRFRIA